MADEDGGTTPSDKAEKPDFYPNFALIAAGVAAVIGLWIILVAHLFSDSFGLSEKSWRSLSGGGQLAARLIAPVSVLGLVMILAGSWMAVVEWRGTFKKVEPKPPADDHATLVPTDPKTVAEVITAVGKLRGASLLIVAGVLMMFLSAWVAKSVSDDHPAGPTPVKIAPGNVSPGDMPPGHVSPRK